MVNSDGTNPLSTNKSAATRMQNIQRGAKRAQLVDQTARSSVRNHTNNKAPVEPVRNMAAQAPSPAQQGVQMPSGGPQASPEAAQGFDPQVFKQDVMDQIVGQIRTQDFINSAMVKDAATSVRLKNIYNKTNPNAIQDPRNLIQQVLSRIGYQP